MKWWLNYYEEDKYIKGMCKSRKWIENRLHLPSISSQKHLVALKFDAEQDGKIADDFEFGRKRLIPIVFSHGLTDSRGMYQVTASEMASHGYIMFLIDHHDGTCSYTESKDGEYKVEFDDKVPFFNYEDMAAKTKLRESEIKSLIDAINKPKFL